MSAKQAKEKIEENFAKELKAGRMYGPWPKEEVYRRIGFFRTNPLGAVVKGAGSFRPIGDLSYRQIPVAVDQWRFLMVLDFNDEVLLDTRVQFGGVAGCGTFGWAAEAQDR